MMKAPRASHESQLGRTRIVQKRSGLFRSTIKKKLVMARKSRPSRGAPRVSLELSARLSQGANAAITKAPAAIDFVHR